MGTLAQPLTFTEVAPKTLDGLLQSPEHGGNDFSLLKMRITAAITVNIRVLIPAGETAQQSRVPAALW